MRKAFNLVTVFGLALQFGAGCGAGSDTGEATGSRGSTRSGGAGGSSSTAAGTGGSQAGTGGTPAGKGGIPDGTGGTSGGAGAPGTAGRGGTMGGAGATGGGESGGTPGGAGAPGTAGRGGTMGGAGATGGGGSGGTPGGAGAAGTGGRGGTTGSAGATGGGGSGGSTPTQELWVGPNGSDTNPGTQAMPFKTLTPAHAMAVPGTTIWLLPGTNAITPTQVLSKSGTAAAPILIVAMAGGTRPVLDFGAQAFGPRGIEVTGNYWVLRGFEIERAGDNCIAVSGAYNLFDQLVIHGCSDTGLQISASSADATDDTKAAYNQVINCDSYENLDQPNNGENADGFAAKLRIGPGNVFRGCRAWNNGDDGWDFFASDDVVTVDNCWAFLNGKVLAGSNSAGDGNGFKLGGAPNGAGQGGAVHLVTNSYAFDNRACGFVRNNNPEVPMVSNCGANANGTNYCSITSNPQKSITMTGAQGKAAVRQADGSLPAIQ